MIILYTYAIFWITLLAHEMGHYVFARKYNLDIKKVSLGNGFKLFSIGVFDIHILPITGYVEVEDQNEAAEGKKGWEELTTKEFFLFNNMASLFQGVAVIVISFFLFLNSISIFAIMMFVSINGFMILFNILPIPGTDAGDYVVDKHKLYENRQSHGH